MIEVPIHQAGMKIQALKSSPTAAAGVYEVKAYGYRDGSDNPVWYTHFVDAESAHHAVVVLEQQLHTSTSWRWAVDR